MKQQTQQPKEVLHTQQQWQVIEWPGKKQPFYKIATMDNDLIADVFGGNGSARDNKELTKANAELIVAACNYHNELFQMVRDLKDCIKRLTEDDLSQFDRDKEAEWIGEAHELLLNINPNYYKNANE